MGALVLILPILAVDVWLILSTGRRQIVRWRESNRRRNLALAAFIGLMLAVWLTFFFQYGIGGERHKGFPIPLLFFREESHGWAPAAMPLAVLYVAGLANFLTGLAAPFIPYKIGEFIQQVKAEMK